MEDAAKSGQPNMFPVRSAYKLSQTPQAQRFLVADLWADEAVGIIGGEPKCCKSFLALTLGVAVASGKPCLGQFAVAAPGPVLLYPAEDSLATVRSRIEGICVAQGIDFAVLPLYVITVPRLQLDVQTDRAQLRQTIERCKPKLLILDPFVRMHAIDENASGEVAPLLQHLRCMQRNYQTAIALVHHAKKGASFKRPGQALRGSSDFHAWGDSNLYLTRSAAEITLTIEHRAAAAIEPLALKLRTSGETAYLEINQALPIKEEPPKTPSPQQLILALLSAAQAPLRIRAIREQAGLRHETVSSTIAELLVQGIIQQTEAGFRPNPSVIP
jgi:RecA-family ATPase